MDAIRTPAIDCLPSTERDIANKNELEQWIENYSSNVYGIWVQCCKCEKWRFVKEYEEHHQIPEVWLCSMNSDVNYNYCEAKQQEGDFESADVDYVPGSIVWGLWDEDLWWPGMVEYDTDSNLYYSYEGGLVTHYCVSFFWKKMLQLWVEADRIKPFTGKEILPKSMKETGLLAYAQDIASKAFQLKIPERLKKYSHIYRNETVSEKNNEDQMIVDQRSSEKDRNRRKCDTLCPSKKTKSSADKRSSFGNFGDKQKDTDNKASIMRKKVSKDQKCKTGVSIKKTRRKTDTASQFKESDNSSFDINNMYMIDDSTDIFDEFSYPYLPENEATCQTAMDFNERDFESNTSFKKNLANSSSRPLCDDDLTADIFVNGITSILDNTEEFCWHVGLQNYHKHSETEHLEVLPFFEEDIFMS